MSKVLVIHPDDRSTDFLKRIYEGKGYDVINDCNIEVKDLIRQIKSHDKIVMMGHGTPYGLIDTSSKHFGYIISDGMADLLRNKETVSIWCNSDMYFKRHGIINKESPQLHTGMIISEVGEELYVLGKVVLDKNQILDNMNLFADSVKSGIDTNGSDLAKAILNGYQGNDEVTEYNRNNILFF